MMFDFFSFGVIIQDFWNLKESEKLDDGYLIRFIVEHNLFYPHSLCKVCLYFCFSGFQWKL